MATQTRTKYLISTGAVTTFTALITWLYLTGTFSIETSPDMVCDGTPFYNTDFKANISDCQIFINITSKNFTYYIKNKQGFELGFSPSVKDYDIYTKDGRFKSGWRPVDKAGNFTFTKGKKYQYMVFVFKEPNQTVKWSITAADAYVDPILFGIEKDTTKYSTKQNCYNITQNRTEIKTNIKQCFYPEISNECTNKSGPNTGCTSKDVSYYYNCSEPYNEIVYFNTLKCDDLKVKIIETKDRTYELNEGRYNCQFNSKVLTCDSCDDGNCDGVCQSGESCQVFDDTVKILDKRDTPKLSVLNYE